MKIELRNPNKIMKLSRLGSFHQSKLSFLRSFLDEFKDWEFKRDVSQKKFDLEQSIISDTRKILDIQDQYGNNPDAVMSDADKATLEELSLNQQSNINFLKQISDPGDAEQVESLVLYQSHIIQRVYKKYIKPNHHLVRFHVGLEDPKDLIEDLRKAIKKIR